MLIRIEENRKNIFLIIQKNNIRNKRKLRRMNKILVTKSAVFCLRFNDFQIFSKFILCPLLSFHTNRYCTSSWNYSSLYNIIKIYCFSWLPFSVFCIISESSDIFDHEGYCLMITFSLCHIIGVSTCCTNPILYGFLNPNFKSVYKNICFKVSQIDFD